MTPEEKFEPGRNKNFNPRIALKELILTSAMLNERPVGDLSFIDKLPIERVELVLTNLIDAIHAVAGNIEDS